jgi:predicted NBD/HSP70 family sugar kinase
LWGKNLYELIGSVVSLPFTVENDGKCGALAEVWKGNLADVDDGVVVILGTGNAGGVIKNRKVHRGLHDTAGEISYLMVRPGEYGVNNILCMHAAMMGLTMKVAAAKGYGQSSLESASLRRADSNVYQGPQPGSRPAASDGGQLTIDGPQIFRWIEAGDAPTLQAYREFIAALGMILFNLQVVYDPEKIAIGGGISRIPRLLPDIQAELDRIQQGIAQLFSPTVNLVPCTFLGDANLVGAMYNFIQRD